MFDVAKRNPAGTRTIPPCLPLLKIKTTQNHKYVDIELIIGFYEGKYMTLLMLAGIVLVLVGIGFMGLSARYFYLGFSALLQERKLKKYEVKM